MRDARCLGEAGGGLGPLGHRIRGTAYLVHASPVVHPCPYVGRSTVADRALARASINLTVSLRSEPSCRDRQPARPNCSRANSAGINQVLPPTTPFALEVCGDTICEGLDDVFNYVTPGYNDVTGLGVPYVPLLALSE